MAAIDIISLTNWIDKLISYPGIDNKEFTLRKSYFISRAAILIGIMIINIIIILTNPQIKILIGYGFFLIFIFFEFLAACIFMRRNLEWLMFINQLMIIIGTFLCIVKLGGILHSGGLIFVGFFVVLLSLDFKRNSHSVWIFITYITTVIIAGFLNPYLIVHPEMTSDLNVFLFVIILVWISFVALLFVLNFIAQYIKIEHLEANRIKELDEMKSKLYSNITHEFRTPLTNIIGISDMIKDNPEKWLDEGIKKIENNSKILLHQINQMLDLSKLEASAMPIHMIQSDINIYIRYIIELFRSVADNQNIQMEYSPKAESLIMDYDPDTLLHIISNLVSNALKYTQSGGKVEIIASLINKITPILEVQVIDNGPGIEKDHLPFIFDRFYRAENKDIQGSEGGSGLGLALTRELVKLLNGTIEVKSTAGKGSKFIVCLPVSNTAKLVEGIEIGKKEIEISTFIAKHDKKSLSYEEINEYNNKPILLIVEDNFDLIFYLQNLFNPEYNIQVATNGKQGLEKAFELIPDIILSDIMMPEMDGIELLEKVKNDIRTSHIPVVMLTAKADTNSRIAGLKRGADAYLAKPFNKEELKIQLDQLIQIRKKLHDRYSQMGQIQIENKDFQFEDSFMQKIQETMISCLAEETFEITKFCLAVAMSRAQLYRKFKSLTNKTIGEYFKTFRLNKAKELLMKPGINVSEAAWQTGFKNLSHFSRVFTEEFGINPSEIHR